MKSKTSGGLQTKTRFGIQMQGGREEKKERNIYEAEVEKRERGDAFQRPDEAALIKTLSIYAHARKTS